MSGLSLGPTTGDEEFGKEESKHPSTRRENRTYMRLVLRRVP